MHVQSCCFANTNLLSFCRSRCHHRRRCLSSLISRYPPQGVCLHYILGVSSPWPYKHDTTEQMCPSLKGYCNLATSVRPTGCTGCCSLPISSLILRKCVTSGLLPRRLKPTRSNSGPGPISCDCKKWKINLKKKNNHVYHCTSTSLLLTEWKCI